MHLTSKMRAIEFNECLKPCHLWELNKDTDIKGYESIDILGFRNKLKMTSDKLGFMWLERIPSQKPANLLFSGLKC
jgi:hypothetical protein